jgi:hypothetical protein
MKSHVVHNIIVDDVVPLKFFIFLLSHLHLWEKKNNNNIHFLFICTRYFLAKQTTAEKNNKNKFLSIYIFRTWNHEWVCWRLQIVKLKRNIMKINKSTDKQALELHTCICRRCRCRSVTSNLFTIYIYMKNWRVSKFSEFINVIHHFQAPWLLILCHFAISVCVRN